MEPKATYRHRRFLHFSALLLSDSGIALPAATEKAARTVVENLVQGDGRTISFITTTLWLPFQNSTCISTRVCAIIVVLQQLGIGKRILAKHSALRQCLDFASPATIEAWTSSGAERST